MEDSKKVERHRDVFFDELNSQRADDEDEGYDNAYEPLAGGDRYTPPPGSLHDAVQYGDESQEPPYGDESEESPADEEQHLIGENVMEDPLHDSDDSDTIVLRPVAVDTHRTGEAKRGLRRSERITRPMAKATEAAEASAAHTVTRMLQRQSLVLMTKSHNMAPEQICREPTTYKRAMCSTDATLWQQAMKEEYDSLMKNKTWDLVPRPDTRKVLKGKWVYKIKKDPQG